MWTECQDPNKLNTTFSYSCSLSAQKLHFKLNISSPNFRKSDLLVFQRKATSSAFCTNLVVNL